LNVWSGLKCVLMHLRIPLDHRKLFSNQILVTVWSS
jgi:hypothetical protein